MRLYIPSLPLSQYLAWLVALAGLLMLSRKVLDSSQKMNSDGPTAVFVARQSLRKWVWVGYRSQWPSWCG